MKNQVNWQLLKEDAKFAGVAIFWFLLFLAALIILD